ncbi:protein Aster-A-like isoform X3 [Eriocheir sinensis]|nr:protein Aster-A-like isoform X3 [Eriocheir sinensis]
MGDGREQVSVQDREQQQQQQGSRDNTENDEPPTTPPPPPPQSSGVAGGGGGCPQENQHAGKELLNAAVPLPIEMVFNLLFQQEQFMLDVYTMKKTYDVIFSQWEEQDGGHRARQTTYTMTLPSSNLGPKVSYVTEKQVILSNSKPGEAYVVELEASNTGIPYADAFVVASHYCLSKEEDNKTRVKVWVSIKYKKALWGLVKTMIEKNTYSGVEGLLAEMMTQLGTEADRLAAPRANRKKRRLLTDRTTKDMATPSHARGKKADKGEGGSSLAVVAVVVSLLVLAAGNVVLYLKLSQLEQMSPSADPSTPGNRYLSVTGSWEAVAKVLHRQQEMHQNQLEVWKRRLQQTAALLQESYFQVQDSLEGIVKSIPEHEEDLRKVLEQQSADVLAGWLQAEDALKKLQSESFLTNIARDTEARPTESANET